MKRLKSEQHHWWPKCVSQRWAADDGKTGWLKPDGSVVRVPPAKLGVIGNGHHIKLGNDGEPTPWDQSFERVFDKADNAFPNLIKWLEALDRRPVRGVPDLRQRFVVNPCADEHLLHMTECAVSLAVRSPMNREACVMLAEQFQNGLSSAARNAIIGLNMRNSQRVVADSIGTRGKFVVVYAQEREFVFGDGFFHSVRNAQMAPNWPKIFVPITPRISVIVCRPSRYMVEPKLTTRVLDDHEVDICNHAVQVYSKNAIYFRSQQPVLHDAFRSAQHLCFEHPGNPIDSLIHSIPGVAARSTSFDHLYDQKAVAELK